MSFKKDNSLSNRLDYLKLITILTVIFMVVPTFFITNESINKSEILMLFSNVFLDELKNIENIAIVASSNNLYWKAKFLITWNIFLAFILFIIMLYKYLKAYLYSLNLIKNCNSFYLIKGINKNSIDRSIYMLFFSIFLIYIITEILYLGNFFVIESGYRYSLLFKNEITISLISGISLITISSRMAYIIIELLAHIRKKIKGSVQKKKE